MRTTAEIARDLASTALRNFPHNTVTRERIDEFVAAVAPVLELALSLGNEYSQAADDQRRRAERAESLLRTAKGALDAASRLNLHNTEVAQAACMQDARQDYRAYMRPHERDLDEALEHCLELELTALT